jgi:iron complex transport system permease protein
MVIFLAIMVLAFSLFASIIFGSTKVSLSHFFTDVIRGNTASCDYRIIYYVRLPRALAGALAGMALAVSGVIIQAVLHNSLASPNIIGVNSSAGFFSLLIIGIFPGHLELLPIAAIGGALLAIFLVYCIAAKTGSSRITLTLSGIAISSIFTAGMNTVKTFFPDTLYNASTFLMGGFYGVSYKNIGYTWILILGGITLACMLSKEMDLLMLGDLTAKSLGMNLLLYRFILLTIASILAGCAVSFSGLIGFVGLIIPHMVRWLIGNGHRLLIIVSMAYGASFVLLCDLISRCLFAPFELPVGIILSFLGGPFFLILILSKKRGDFE